ncbi:hypothetical protein [Streptomyces sp. CRN 30]|uniref:hypothetical protein n=1 Tax=Streptomyces sp. CRN 30 TaxID=3075613 RepID=UPI002A7F3085|nr:hypothetical protein [Streptomyces sp. CRN 30]
MRRFLLGLGMGAAGSVIAWAATHSPGWTVVIGLTVAVLIWFCELVLDDLI